MNYQDEHNRGYIPHEYDHPRQDEPYSDRYADRAEHRAPEPFKPHAASDYNRHEHHDHAEYAPDWHEQEWHQESREGDFQESREGNFYEESDVYVQDSRDYDDWEIDPDIADGHREPQPDYRLTRVMQDRYYDEDTDYRTDPQFAGPAESGGSGIRLSHDDLRDVGVNPLSRYTGKKFAKVAAVTLFFAFGVLVVLSTKPDVTAYDIVSMDSYEGQQQPEWALDLEIGDGCDSLSACFKESLAMTQKKNEATPDPKAVMEIPARSIQPDVPEIVSTVNVVEPTSDRMRVARQWSNIRTEPGMSGAILTSIASGSEVHIIGQSGTWYEIVTADDRAIQGFMHQSTLK